MENQPRRWLHHQDGFPLSQPWDTHRRRNRPGSDAHGLPKVTGLWLSWDITPGAQRFHQLDIERLYKRPLLSLQLQLNNSALPSSIRASQALQLYFYTMPRQLSFLPVLLCALLPLLSTAFAFPPPTTVSNYLTDAQILHFDSLMPDLAPPQTNEKAIDLGQPKYHDLLESLANGTYTPPALRNNTTPLQSRQLTPPGDNRVLIYQPLRCEGMNSAVFTSDAHYLINVVAKNWANVGLLCDQTDRVLWRRTLGRHRTAHLAIRGFATNGVPCRNLQYGFETLLRCPSYKERVGASRKIEYMIHGYRTYFELVLSSGLHDMPPG